MAAGLAKHCQIEIAHAIGVANPVSVYIDTLGTGVISDGRIAEIVAACFDLRPAKIIEHLALAVQSTDKPQPMAISAEPT